MISLLLSRLVLLVCGTLYPAYASYKTVKTKNVRDYVKWMMYWIVFAAYTFVEIFADVFLAFWFPFYYELKIVFVLWLVSPATRGSTYLFRKVINPRLSRHETLIDSYIASLWDHGYDLARMVGSRGVDYLIEILLELVRKGQITMNQFLPHVAEIAQQASAPQSSPARKVSNVPDLNDEDFVIMTDQSEVDEPSTSDNLQPPDPFNEAFSEAEETEVKKIQTRSRRASALRERKKTSKK